MKVLKYKSDGNTLIEKGMILEKLNDSVFFHKWEENVYGLKVYYDIVFLLGNTYFWANTLSDSVYNANKDKLLVYDETFVKQFIFSGFPSTLKIEVAKRESLDVDSLLKTRDSIIQDRKDKEEAKKQEDIKRALEVEERERIALDKSLKEFLEGQRINKDHFVTLCKNNGVELHIRTIGMLNSLAECSISYDSADLKGNAKKIRAMNLDKVFIAAKELKSKFCI